MASVVVVGAQWGDEGKGKVVDILSEFADLVVRFQGGSNAGHTLVLDGEQLVTHLVPSGVARPNKRCAIGPAVLVDPELLVAEIATLRARGLLTDPASLLISHRSHVVLPYHKLLDSAREATKGSHKLGTTLRGIGPCLEDKVARVGVRMCDLRDTTLLTERLAARLPEVNALLVHHGREPLAERDLLAGLVEQAAELAPFVGDVGEAVRADLDRGRNVLFEGAQGALLDIDHGTYPFVTGSSTLAAAACAGLGFGPTRIGAVVCVAKAYSTRVGEGPFPTELQDERGRKLQAGGGEFGATTGRPRRCGWLDLPALRYAAALNGATSVCLTKLDVLGGIGPLRMAVGYKLDGQPVDSFPADARLLQRIEPVYEEFEGWTDELAQLREMEDLPAPARRYLDRVQHDLNTPIDILSVGPSRAETLMLNNPFRRKN